MTNELKVKERNGGGGDNVPDVENNTKMSALFGKKLLKEPTRRDVDYDADADDFDDDEAGVDDDDEDDDANIYELNEIIIDNSPTSSMSPIPKANGKKHHHHQAESSSLSVISAQPPKVTGQTTATTTTSTTSTKNKKKHSSILKKLAPLSSNNDSSKQQKSDSTSSSESGFGTVDDEIESNGHVNTQTQKLNKECLQEIIIQNDKNMSPHSANSNNKSIMDIRLDQYGKMENEKDSTGNSSQQLPMSSFPILQPPRQIVYELNTNNNNSDDAINILNSSVNSSMSSSSSSNRNCCSKLMYKLLKFYYKCCCCYASGQDEKPFICTWVSIFCCCCPLLGCISLYLTHRSRKYKSKQNYDLADKYSNCAEKLNIASLICGIIFYAIAFFMITLVLFMYWRPNHS